MKPKIKICGLTKLEEANMLNEVNADYGGFVFFEKSKRNVSLQQAFEIKKVLNPEIKSVAVTVSPDLSLIEKIEKIGFDIIQIHGELKQEVLEKVKTPIWRAYNIENKESLKQLQRHENIAGYVADAKVAGSGKTFDWDKNSTIKEETRKYFDSKLFILAGGLSKENVRKGIELFNPDVVDVSSSVEGKCGKDKELIEGFALNCRNIIDD